MGRNPLAPPSAPMPGNIMVTPPAAVGDPDDVGRVPDVGCRGKWGRLRRHGSASEAQSPNQGQSGQAHVSPPSKSLPKTHLSRRYSLPNPAVFRPLMSPRTDGTSPPPIRSAIEVMLSIC